MRCYWFIPAKSDVSKMLPYSFLQLPSTPQGSPGVDRNTFLSSPHLCFIIVFIRDLFVSRDDPLMSLKTSTRTEQLYVLSHDRS